MNNNSENTREGSNINSESTTLSSHEIEKVEENKLKAKYPLVSGWPVSGHSVFLQKKLAKGQKYFDSGDYQMAKQISGGVNKTKSFPTGGEIPTPDSVPARKTSIIQPKFNPTVQ